MAEHKNHIPFIITLLVIGWGLLIVVNVLRAGWSGPSAAPPDGNPSSFLTSGSNPETKSGPLTISNNFYVTDNVNLGSTSTPTSARLVINPQSNASIDAGNGFIRTTYIPNYDYDVVTKNYLVSSLGASSYWILSGNSLYPTSTVEKVVIGTDPNNTNDSGFEYGNGYNPSMSNYNNLRFRVNSFFESPFVSMGIAQNFLLRSEAFDHTSWVKTDIGSTVSADGITAPNGKVTAENIPAGTTSTANIAQTITNSSTVTPWSAGVWARAQSGTTTMKLRLDSTSATGTEVAFNLDTNWRFYSITQEFTSSHTTKTFRIINGTSAISLWGARMNPGPTVNAYYYTTSSGLTSPYNGVFFNYSNVYASTFSGSLSGNASSANYASGLYGGFTQSNSIDKTNQWEYIGYIYLYYSSTYRYGQSWNVELKIKELDRIGALTPDNYGETTVRLQGKMPSVVNGTEFNTTTPTFTLDIANSKGSLGPNDLAMLVYSSNTSAKYIRLYVKLKSSDSHYVIVPINQYGSSYNSSGGISTSYCYYVSVGSQTSVASLPTPAQGSVVYATQRFDNSDFWRSNNIDSSGKVGIGTTSPAASLAVNGNAIANTPTADGHLATKAYVDSASQSLWVKNGSNLYASSTSWNVGIGTTNPNNKLEIKYLSTSTDQTQTSAYGLRISNSGWNSNQVSGIEFWNGSNNKTVPTSRIVSQMNGGGGGGENLYFQTQPSSASKPNPNQPTTKLTILADGNVGIGTTSPAASLAVNGNAIANPPTADGHLATKGYVDSMASAASSALWVNSGSNLYASSTSWNVGIGTTNPGTAKLAVMGGNMGIGTTNPKGLLQIDSSTSDPLKLRVHTELGSANSLAGIAFGVDTGNQYMKSAIALQRKNSNGQGDLVFMVDSNSDGSNVDINDEKLRIQGSSGNVGIGTTSPSYKLDVNGGGSFTQFVFVPTPTADGHAVNKAYVNSVFSSTTANYVLKTGDTMTGTLEFATSTQVYTAINLNGNNISAVHKLGVVVIDPLYDIGGTKYSSYAPSVVGGVKEEHIGKGTIKDCNHNVCSWVLDFSKVAKGSDLWVWRQIVDFRPETIDVLMTAYGRPASLSYEIGDNQIIFYADHPTQFSYRLVGSRFDWRQWPTLALDQSEPTSLIVP